MEYLSLPLVLREGYLSRCSLEESIIYSVGLILSTRLGQLPFSPEFGCKIWEREYSDIVRLNKADLRGNLRNSIDKHEKRLQNVAVSVSGFNEKTFGSLGVVVTVSGRYMDGNKEMTLKHGFRIG